MTSITRAMAEIEEQSDSIAASVEELAVSLRGTSDTSSVTAAAVGEIAATAKDGRALIERLGEAGQQIVGIVDTITALSSQTNMLALNATIEAERAGSAGRGFAVVADEVKDLAKRTAESAAQITRVIDTVLESVRSSTKSMTTIADMVDGLTDNQAMLHAAVREQASTVDHIAEAATEESAHMAGIGEAIRRLQANTQGLTDGTDTDGAGVGDPFDQVGPSAARPKPVSIV